MMRRTVTADELRRLGQQWLEVHADFKALDAGDASERRIKGYASTGSVDRLGDIVEPAAFKKAIKRFLKANPMMLAHHNPELVVGRFTGAEIDDKGLVVEGQIGVGTDPTDPMERIWNRVSQRFLRAFSIGFQVLRREDILNEGQVTGWRILDLDLYEISVVSIPANPETYFDLAKAVKYGTDADYDLYGRGLWAHMPRLTTETKRVHDDEMDSLAPAHRAMDGLTKRLAVIRGG